MTDGPNFDAYLNAILRRNDPSALPIGELFVEHAILQVIAGEPIDPGTDEGVQLALDLHARLGYDAMTAGASPGFQMAEWSVTEDVAPLSRGQRAYVTASASRIWDRESFDAYEWPTPSNVDYGHLERVARLLPDGMKALGSCGGPCEWLMWIIGYEPLSYMLADDPELVHQVMAKIREQMLAVWRELVTMDGIGAMWISDDMGHKTGPFLAPDHMREFILPTQKALAEVAHAAGLPVLLHSCGNLESIMDDLIDDVGIDAKHSWEDVIMPVAEAKRLWGERIGIIGGIDVDALYRRSPEEVRRYTLDVLEACAPGGGYLLGSGNSVANYVPVGNYMAMLDAWREW
jgi:uroporphyrinogen decarboxylase